MHEAEPLNITLHGARPLCHVAGDGPRGDEPSDTAKAPFHIPEQAQSIAYGRSRPERAALAWKCSDCVQ